MKQIIALFLMMATFVASAGDITPGISLVDGQRLTAAELAQLVNQAVINPSFYTSQTPSGTNLQAGDIVLVVSAGGVFHKVLGSGIINNPASFTSQVLKTNVPNYATFLYYDPTNNWLAQITQTNLAYDLASNTPVQLLVFTKTNSGSGDALVPVLASYPTPLNFYSTNNQVSFMLWDTNGIPNYVTFSNFVTSFVPPLGSNVFLPYEYTNNFFPWLFLNNTNATTNAYGTYTNFPITNLFFTNAAQTNPALQTVTNSDVIPILAGSQLSNTTVNLDTLYQYFSNRNGFPAYAVARTQFSGLPYTTYAQRADQGNKTFQFGTNGIVGVQAVSFQFSATSANSLPTTPQVTSNAIYYAVQTLTNTNFVQIYTNYNDAAAANTNVIVPNTSFTAAGTTSNGVLILTNFTRYNADAIQLTTGSAVRTGYYDICFRTNLTTTNYYLSGSTILNGSGSCPSLYVAEDNIIQTNKIRVATFDRVNFGVGLPRVEALIQPE